MGRHRFPFDDYVARIANDMECHPEEVAIDNVKVDGHDLVVDARVANPNGPGPRGER